MAKSMVAIVILVFALVGTNAWWAVNAFDTGISRSYERVSLEDNEAALSQAIAVISELANPKSSRESIIQAAAGPVGDSSSFEKDGFVWVGSVGLRFDESGRLLEVVPGWGPQ